MMVLGLLLESLMKSLHIMINGDGVVLIVVEALSFGLALIVVNLLI